MPRLDISPLTTTASSANKSATDLNRALDDMESKHAALVAATTAYNDSITTADESLTAVTSDITATRDAAAGLLGQSITLPSPVEVPDDLPEELLKTRKLSLKK